MGQIKIRTLKHLSLFLIALSIVACSSSTKKNKQQIDSMLEPVEEHFMNSESSDEDVIFYNIFSPIDGHKAWKGKSSYYNSNLINPLNNITRYQNSQKVALNLGVYGADLSYLWMFNQNQQSLSYLMAVERLSANLGIPNEFVKLTAKTVENNNQNLDTMIQFGRRAYLLTDQYLKKSNRESSANLVLLGGWIESLYIATHMYAQPNEKLASKIASQKFSLNSLYNLLQNNQDDLITKEYLLLLGNLRKAFDKFEIKFQPNNISIDTVRKRITIKENEVIDLDPKHFKEIKHITSQIRKHIIE